MPVEVKSYIKSDGVKVAGYVRNSKGEGGASVFRGKKGTTVAGNWKSSSLHFNPRIEGNLTFSKSDVRKGNLSIDSDIGKANANFSKKGGLEVAITPNIAGIAKAVGTFLKDQAQKATEAPGTVADAATQAAQDVRTSTEAIIPTDVSPGVTKAAVGAAVVGGAALGTVAAPALLPAAATPSIVSAAATGTALVIPPVGVAGLLPAAGATVARGGAIALTAAPPPGATTIARAAVAPTIKKASQSVVPMVGSRGKFKVVDSAGKTLMSNLNKQQASKMAGQFGQILS